MSSNIEWTEDTWNPTIGCSKVSPGCKNCYAIQTAWVRMGNPNPKIQAKFKDTVEKTASGALNWTGNINLGQDALLIPINKKKPTLYFVNSMSDVFHPNVWEEWIDEIFAVMAICRHHTFQVLTKHPDNMLAYFKGDWRKRVHDKLEVVYSEQSETMFSLCVEAGYNLQNSTHLPNVWLGVSVENQQYADERIPLLLQCPAEVRFLSCEPLLGSVELTEYLSKIQHPTSNIQLHWVIVGGESGPDARPMFPTWAQGLRDQCQAAGVAFFFKQWGEWLPFNNWKESSARKKGYMWADGTFEEDIYFKDGVGGQIMAKVGKKKAGKLLDGMEWTEMPGDHPNPAG